MNTAVPVRPKNFHSFVSCRRVQKYRAQCTAFTSTIVLLAASVHILNPHSAIIPLEGVRSDRIKLHIKLWLVMNNLGHKYIPYLSRFLIYIYNITQPHLNVNARMKMHVKKPLNYRKLYFSQF
jgi:hypothetical protein